MQNIEQNDYRNRLHQHLQTSFEHEFLDAIFENFDTGGPLRLNNFSYALRELIRNILARMAPESEVRACDWFNNEGIPKLTRADRITYSIQGGLSHWYVNKKLNMDLSHVITTLISIVNDLSKYTHILDKTFNLPEDQVCDVARNSLKGALLMFNTIQETREKLINELTVAIDSHLIEHLLSETIQNIDELSTHHWVDSIYSEEIMIKDITPLHIKLEVSGGIECALQWGSSSDVKNDLGALGSESFPLTAQVLIDIKKPLGKYGLIEAYTVNTDSWYE